MRKVLRYCLSAAWFARAPEGGKNHGLVAHLPLTFVPIMPKWITSMNTGVAGNKGKCAAGDPFGTQEENRGFQLPPAAFDTGASRKRG